MASTRTEVDAEFYRFMAAPRSAPLQVSFQLGYVGNCSLNTVATLNCRRTAKVYATNVNQVVLVDKATREVTPIPEWWRTKYASFSTGQASLVIARMPVLTPKHECAMVIRWSDVDLYRHTNYLSYVQFCLDCAMDAVVGNFYSKLKDDILLYNTKEIQMLYINETKAGEALHTATWQDADDPLKIHFNIRCGDKPIFQSSIVLYDIEWRYG